MAAFAEWQPKYAEQGIATFPVRDKRPAVKGYLKTGLRASSAYRDKFPSDEAFGFACLPAGLTILDVDTPDERVLCDALSEFGPTPIIVRSGSGNYQAWYRNSGEGRKVRPDPERPIDILGGGFVVAPPSVGSAGRYEMLQGGLTDLAHLPTMRRAAPPPAILKSAANDAVPVGQRNETLWRACMAKARSVQSIEELMMYAAELNRSTFYDPLPDSEVLKVVASAWMKEISGENWFGEGRRVVFSFDDIDGLLATDPDAFTLLTLLKRKHINRSFVLANAMADHMPGGGWSRKRFAGARHRLEAAGEIELIRAASRHAGPPLYAFKGGRK